MDKEEKQPEVVNLAPALTRAQLKKNDELQEELREQFSFVANSTESRAASIISSNLDLLKVLREQWKGRLKQTERGQLKQAIFNIELETTQWMQTLGMFEAMVKIAPDDEHFKLFKEYDAADKMPDAVWMCGHTRWSEQPNGDMLPNYYSEFTYHSARRGTSVSMLRCKECGKRNVMASPSDLVQMRNMRRSLASVQTGDISADKQAVISHQAVERSPSGTFDLTLTMKKF